MQTKLKWLSYFLAVLLFVNCGGKKDESIAIKTLLEKESATWRSGDVKAHADCWKIQPYTRILVSLPNGKTIDVPPASILNPQPGAMGKGGVAKNSNYKFGIYENAALVSHDEESTASDGKKTYSYEMLCWKRSTVNGN
ncbi:MAG: endo-arabinase [Bacteroidota bacterium]|nr:endo-arabinase [Bacteroidota bacterium]